MIHASVELVEAMRGMAPPDYIAKPRVACLNPNGGLAVPAFFYEAGFARERRRSEPPHPVTCPACLCLMRAAVDPVRWDYLEERGFAPKLEAA